MDMEKVIKGLQEIVDDNWMKTHADWYVSVCSDALALLKEQGEEIEKLKEIIKKADYTLEIAKDKINDLLKKTEGR